MPQPPIPKSPFSKRHGLVQAKPITIREEALESLRMDSLECVARDIGGSPKATLGEILKRQPELLPKPLDSAVEKIWGCASNEARHVAEGLGPNREEAELIVGLAATVATYLTRKNPQQR